MRATAGVLALSSLAGAYAFGPSAPLLGSSAPQLLSSSVPQPLSFHNTQLPRTRGLRGFQGLKMQESEDDEGEVANRAERRYKAKMSKKGKKAAATKGFGASPQTAVQVSEMMSQAPPEGAKKDPPEAIKYLEKMRQETIDKREEVLRNRGKAPPGAPQGLPLEKQLQGVDAGILFGIERTLFFGIFTAGFVWVMAGVVTAYESYLVATKQQVPKELDSLLSNYAYPSLTPGLAVILGSSLLLGLLQVYKFEGGKNMDAPKRKSSSNDQGPL